MTSNEPEPTYAVGALHYRQAGWRSVLPLPAGQKKPLVAGFSGYEGAWPTDEDYDCWLAAFPNSNTGLRMHYDLVGIDVDAYDGKTGERTLKEAENRWGLRPPTYRSSARPDDPVSGTGVFGVPVGSYFRSEIKFADDLRHVDIIQPHHRVVTVWPSIHKSGGRYRWYAPDGELMPEGWVPRVEDLPELPPEWVQALAKNAIRNEVFDGSAPNRSRSLREQINEELYQKLIGHHDQTAPDRLVEARVEAAVADLMSGSASRYESVRDHVAALMRMQASGRVGVPRALNQLSTAYVLEVGDTRPAEVAEAEFLRFTQGAAMLIAATPLPGQQPSAAQSADSDAGAVPEAPSWTPIDMTDVIAGEQSCLTPTLFRRTDGVCLFYPGLTHSVHGESESGKSLIVQAECARLVKEGHRVLYLDFESDQQSLLDRLRQLGADDQAVANHFHYLRPEVAPTSSEAERQAWEALVATQYTLAVIDGVTEALTVFGRGSLDNDHIAAWNREVPRKIADRTGAAVVLIDHVVKDRAKQNRFALGGQAKLAALTGAAYTVEILQPVGLGMRGAVGLRIAKDRPGQVRNLCGVYRKGDRTQTAARIVIDSTNDQTTVTVEPWDTQTTQESTAAVFRPTNLMQRISRVMEVAAEPMTKTAAVKAAGGNRQAALHAFDLLVQEGYLAVHEQRRKGALFVFMKPYSEADDQLAQHQPY